MPPTTPAVSSTAPGAFRLLQPWSLPIDLVLAVAVSVWIPVRIGYLRPSFATAVVDHLVDLVVLAVMVVDHWPRIRRSGGAAGSGAPASGRWSFAADCIVALPLFTLLAPFLGAGAEFALLVKLLMFRRVFSIHRLLDDLPDLHPVLARLIPLGLVLPIVINLLACGWNWLGGGTAGTGPDRTLNYVRAVYWTITTLATVGYGDITPNTTPQMIYACMTMLVGIGFFGYVLGNIASLLARLDAAREEHLELLSRVESFMSSNDVPAALRTRVREYHRYVWKSRKGYDVSTVLADLPPTLRVEVALFLNAEIIEKVPVLKGADRQLLEELVLELKPRVIIPAEEVFRTGEPGDGMYFIQRGNVEIVAADGTVLATLGPGSFFGETALLTARPRNATARAADYGDVFMLKRDAFEHVLSRHPVFRQQVQAIAATRSGDTRPPLPGA